MEQTEIQNQVEEILEANTIGTLATVKDNKPFSRYMTFFHENLTLYSATNRNTHKVEDIDQNNDVHVLIGYNGGGLEDAYIEIEGKASIETATEVKQKVWNEKLEPWFEGPEDSAYAVLKIVPSEIRLMNTPDAEPQVLEL